MSKGEYELGMVRQEIANLLGSMESFLEQDTEHGKLFPHGINKIGISASIGETELALEIEGAATSAEMQGFLSTKRVSISFGSNGEGTLSYDGKTVPCLGRTNLAYAKDLTVRGEINVDKFARKYSNEFQVWMDHAILIMGNRGIYIHEGAETLETNGGESAGCIHVGEGEAEAFWNWVDGRTRMLIDYPW